MPKPPSDNPQEWVRWHAHWVGTPAWRPELVKVPTPRDPISFAKWVWASFQFPKVNGMPSCYKQKVTLQARTTGSDSQRRPWHLPKTYSFGQRKFSHLRLINCANWWHVSGN